jgi:hypothetical protein
METTSKDYNLSCEPGVAVLSGQFSLSSPIDFDELFSSIRTGIEAVDEAYTIDVVKADFMSSSGITALARVVMHARNHAKGLVLRVDDGVLWQRKTVVALQNLWDKLSIEKV